MNKVAANQKIISMANKVSKAIELEMEEILEHAEQVVKEFVPARYVKAALTKLETLLDKEGVEALFDKQITREAFRKTAKVEVTAKEINQVLASIVEAVVAEVEDVLKDADEVVTRTVEKFVPAARFEVESKLKNIIEKKGFTKGVYFKMSRTAKKVSK